ncbi:hypothetical protein [Legionella clemsonensis]|uniref:Uncharacterized protein n=1 Tax=Legionella clemsonensis TaxID=1867846 RepID=A0A222P0F2_9GAMM|nr:hypothetical protein [Legionella clemsonensis]ASQ45312.1 hypothetical protein clem_03770 [Legionella clemsonensis]
MTRILALLILLPLINACTIENDYYESNYHSHPSTHYHSNPGAQVEVPYGDSYREPNTHYHYNERMAYKHSNQHGHRNNVPRGKPYTYQHAPNTHGHSNKAITRKGPANNKADSNIHSHENKNSSNHGHHSIRSHEKEVGITTHGHDS